jgi:hypothetical protein
MKFEKIEKFKDYEIKDESLLFGGREVEKSKYTNYNNAGNKFGVVRDKVVVRNNSVTTKTKWWFF